MQTPRQKILPRGLRNNNPLNIRIGNVWLGEVTNPDDPDFEQFVSMAYGCRAAFVLLRRYIRHYHRTTVPAVIAAWAPATENNTAAYVSKVCELAALLPDTELHFSDKQQMCSLVQAMCIVENGRPINMADIERGYIMA